MNGRLEVRIDYNLLNRRWEIYAYEQLEDGKAVPFLISIEKLPIISEGDPLPPTVTLKRLEGQQLFTMLAKELRVNKFGPEPIMINEPQLQAIAAHLEDMRRIAFNFLEPK